MSRTRRTIIFAVLAALFLTAAPSLILYSQGWRVDVAKGTVARTGGLYIKTVPNQAEIYLDGKFAKKTDFLFGTALLENLLPSSLTVEVRKEGFWPWRKVLDTKSHEVTEAKTVLLFEKEITYKTLANGIQNFWPSPDGSSIVIQEQLPGGRWDLSLLRTATGGAEPVLEQRGSAQEVFKVVWAEDGKRFAVFVRDGEELLPIVIHTADSTCSEIPCSLSFVKARADATLFHPLDDSLILTIRQRDSAALLAADYQAGTVDRVLATDTVAFTVTDTKAVWLNGQGELWEASLSQNTPAVRLGGFPVRRETEYELLKLGGQLFIVQDETLFKQTGPEEFQELARGVRDIQRSPNRETLAVLSGSELLLHYLRDQDTQPRHKAGDTVFLNRFSQQPTFLQWLGNGHLVFATGDEVKVAETDERGGVNIAPLGQFTAPAVWLWPKENILYVLSQTALSSSEKLVK